MLRKCISTLLLNTMLVVTVLAQSFEIERVEPDFWWTGFQNSELQLLVYGENIGHSRVEVEASGVELLRVVTVENTNYLFIYLNITENAVAGDVPIHFTTGSEKREYLYRLIEREGSVNRHQGFDASDLIYLVMPDRFANGDPDNDAIEGMIEGVDMDEPYARKGGDIKGVRDRLEYIQDLGMTAIWFNPLLENDMPYNYDIGAGFYHGYAATDMYRVDRRFGSNEEFVELVTASQEMGMKVIMDKIHNHVGTHHWFIKDLPSSDWIHDQSVVGNTNYRTDTLMDPYASSADLNSTVRGWFVDEMPDLNQKNPLLADYLIQNTIWWVEYSGIDGIRMDTHPYPYKEYMAEWTKRVLEEFPTFNIVGEVWMQNVATTAWWQYDFPTQSGYNSYLPSVTDFPLYRAVVSGLNENEGWDTGLARIYYTLGQDFLYTDPNLNVIFVDNHDLTRFMSSVGEDPEKFKLGLAFILTTRGIPQIYYGTEIMKAGGINDPDKRRTFPGGWPGDPIDAFTEEGRILLGEERGLPISEVFEYLSTISEWRKEKDVIHFGYLTHFIPERNVYVYFRHNDEETVMVILNGADEIRELDLNRFGEFLNRYDRGLDIITRRSFDLGQTLSVSGREALILELQ